jgi:hypothetical protein
MATLSAIKNALVSDGYNVRITDHIDWFEIEVLDNDTNELRTRYRSFEPDFYSYLMKDFKMEFVPPVFTCMPCPFCKCRDIRISYIPADNGGYGDWSAKCTHCSAQGPLTNSFERAHELWHARK